MQLVLRYCCIQNIHKIICLSSTKKRVVIDSFAYLQYFFQRKKKCQLSDFQYLGHKDCISPEIKDPISDPLPPPPLPPQKKRQPKSYFRVSFNTEKTTKFLRV